jgi:hypothetical protein
VYIWKAELQKRGQLHYHITTDRFVGYEEIRAKWNELQYKAGYLESFHRKFGHYNPNGTDVHAVYKETKDIVGYLKKKIMSEYKKRDYQAKKEQRNENKAIISEYTKDLQNKKTIGGKVWDCSLNLKQSKIAISVDRLTEARIDQAVKQGKVWANNTEHCTIYEPIGKTTVKELLSYPDRVFLEDHIKKILEFKRNKVLKDGTILNFGAS